jgi:hypothetical protein
VFSTSCSTFPDDVKAHIDLSQNTHLRNNLLGLPHSTISTLTLVLSIVMLDLIINLDWAFLNTVLGYPQFAALERLCFIVHCPSSVIDTNTMEEAIRARVQTHVGIIEVSLVHTSRLFTQCWHTSDPE